MEKCLCAVICDVDGTLLDTERINKEAWRESLRSFGYEASEELLLRTRGIRAERIRQLFETEIAPDFPFEEARRRRNEIAERETERQSPVLKAGAREFLSALNESGILLAVATTTLLVPTKRHLAWNGIDGYFDAIVCGDMVQSAKPAPDLFLKAAEKLGVKPEHCLIAEDSPAGILAAHAANMRCAVVPDLAPLPDEILRYASGVYHDLFEVLKDIRKGTYGEIRGVL